MITAGIDRTPLQIYKRTSDKKWKYLKMIDCDLIARFVMYALIKNHRSDL